MKAVINRFLLSILLATFSLNAIAANRYLWQEAETGAEFNPIVVKADPLASQAIYLASWQWNDYSYRRDDSGKIAFEIYIAEAGYYKLWGRARTPGGIRPFDISLDNADVTDNSAWTSWLNTPALSQWGWIDSGFSAYFSEGLHTLYLIQRSGGPNVHLDKILLTNNHQYIPSGIGSNEGIPNIANPYKANTVEKYGQLKVTAGKLRDKNNVPVQLQGVSFHGLQWFPLIDNQTIPNATEFFGLEAVRLAMYIEDFAPSDPSDYWGGFMADSNAMYRRVDDAIADAVAAGIYVIVDWHIHNAPSNYTAEAEQFFAYIARQYGHLPNIIYEICNEPVGVSWTNGIKPYANRVINSIRQHDPDNIVIVGTPNWSQDVDAAAQDPLDFNNIMYAFHFYAASHNLEQMKNKVQIALNAGLAIFVSEWGSSDVGTSRSDFYVAQQWLNYMNQAGLSWINWSLGNKDEASSVLKATAPMSGPWDNGDLTRAGLFLLPYFDRPQAATDPSGDAGLDPPPVSGPVITDPVITDPVITDPVIPDPVITDTPSPSAPYAWLTATAQTNGILLNWSTSNIDVRHYEVYRDTDANPNGRGRLAILYGEQTYLDTSANVGITYYYWIKVVDTQLALTNTAAASTQIQLTPSAAIITSGSYYRLISQLSGKALDVAGVSREAGANLIQWRYGSGANQQWRISSRGLNQYSLISRHSDMCLDTPYGSQEQGIAMQQWWCNQTSAQNWELIATGNDYYALKNSASGLCLDVAGKSLENGARIIQWKCNGGQNQNWKIEKLW